MLDDKKVIEIGGSTDAGICVYACGDRVRIAVDSYDYQTQTLSCTINIEEAMQLARAIAKAAGAAGRLP